MADPLLENYRKQSLETWEALAPSWAAEQDFRNRMTHAVTDWLVDRLDPKPGDTVLDLATGTGETSFMAATRVGSSGRVISTDFSPQMVEAARATGEKRGLENIDYRVMDTEHMDLDDDSADGVICRFGYMLMADPAKAMAETRRVLRPGRRLVFSVWGPPDVNPWVSQLGMLAVERGLLPPPEPGVPGIFALADPGRIRSLVTGAGFGEPEIEPLEVTRSFRDFDEYFDFSARTAGPVAFAIQKLSDEERGQVRETLRGRMAQFESDSGFSVPGICLNVEAQLRRVGT